jgi:hypothetical protein
MASNPDRLSQGEVIAGRYISETGVTFGDGTVQDTAAGGTISGITRWTPNFTATGLTFTGTGVTHPCYNSYYVKAGNLVTFIVDVQLTTVTNFGTGQFKVELPLMPYGSYANHFNGWVWVDPTQPADELNGHIVIQADHLPADDTLDLHWHQATTAAPKPIIEKLLSQGNPVTLTTASKIQISGTYICA